MIVKQSWDLKRHCPEEGKAVVVVVVVGPHLTQPKSD